MHPLHRPVISVGFLRSLYQEDTESEISSYDDVRIDCESKQRKKCCSIAYEHESTAFARPLVTPHLNLRLLHILGHHMIALANCSRSRAPWSSADLPYFSTFW